MEISAHQFMFVGEFVADIRTFSSLSACCKASRTTLYRSSQYYRLAFLHFFDEIYELPNFRTPKLVFSVKYDDEVRKYVRALKFVRQAFFLTLGFIIIFFCY